MKAITIKGVVARRLREKARNRTERWGNKDGVNVGGKGERVFLLSITLYS